jgi:hypothetical protein
MVGLTFAQIGLALGFLTFREEILTPNIYIIDPPTSDILSLSASNFLYKICTVLQALSAPRFTARINS